MVRMVVVGILSIYLRLKDKKRREEGQGTSEPGAACWRVVSSDYGDDRAIEENIAHNCCLNGVTHHHVPHTWGQPFPFPLLREHYAALGDARTDIPPSYNHQLEHAGDDGVCGGGGGGDCPWC